MPVAARGATAPAVGASVLELHLTAGSFPASPSGFAPSWGSWGHTLQLLPETPYQESISEAPCAGLGAAAGLWVQWVLPHDWEAPQCPFPAPEGSSVVPGPSWWVPRPTAPGSVPMPFAGPVSWNSCYSDLVPSLFSSHFSLCSWEISSRLSFKPFAAASGFL